MAVDYPFGRPVGEYNNEDPQGTKYQTDRTSGVPISSKKMDGDFNALVDAINDLKEQIDNIQVGAIEGITDPENRNKFLTTTGLGVLWSQVEEAYIQARAVTFAKIQEGNAWNFLVFNEDRTLEEFPPSAERGSILTSQGLNAKPEYKTISKLLQGSEEAENASHVLQTDGAGVLSFTSVGADQLQDEGVSLPKIQKQAAKARSVFVTKSDGGAEVADSPPSDKDGYILRSQRTARPKFGRLQSDDMDDDLVKTRHIEDGQIIEAKLTDQAVTTRKIAAESITTEKVSALSITEEKLAQFSVTNKKLGANCVTGAKIADGNVQTSKIGSKAVTTAKINDQAVTTVKVADLSITTQKLAEAAVEERNIKDLAIATNKLADLAVTTSKIAEASVTPNKIQQLGCQPVYMVRWNKAGAKQSEYNPFNLGTYSAMGSGKFKISLTESATNFIVVANAIQSDGDSNKRKLVYYAFEGNDIIVTTSNSDTTPANFAGSAVIYKVA